MQSRQSILVEANSFDYNEKRRPRRSPFWGFRATIRQAQDGRLIDKRRRREIVLSDVRAGNDYESGQVGARRVADFLLYGWLDWAASANAGLSFCQRPKLASSQLLDERCSSL